MNTEFPYGIVDSNMIWVYADNPYNLILPSLRVQLYLQEWSDDVDKSVFMYKLHISFYGNGPRMFSWAVCRKGSKKDYIITCIKDLDSEYFPFFGIHKELIVFGLNKMLTLS